MRPFFVFLICSSAFAAPTCVIVTTKTWRAGDVASLESTGSKGKGKLSFQWQQTAGEPVRWITGQTAPSPQIEPPVFGEYAFRLTITDKSGSTSCTGTLGAVAMDSNGVVVPDTSTPNKAKIHALIGPILARGHNPWDYADYESDFIADLIDTCWNRGIIGGKCGSTAADDHRPRTQPDQWGHGTLTVTIGSPSVTCVAGETGSCQLMTSFCGGKSNWKSYHYLNIRYPISETSPQEYGWQQYAVASCSSETMMTLSTPYINDGYPKGSIHSGLNYSDDNGTYPLWLASSSAGASINYYDTVLFLYQQYYRTGLSKWKNWAEWLADAWWEHPYRDAGRQVNKSSPRTWALTGLTIRHLDGRGDMLPGLRRIWESYINGPGAVTEPRNYGGGRENGYRMKWVGQCGLVDEDPAADQLSLRDSCRKTAVDALSLWQSAQCKAGHGACQQMHNQWVASNGSWGIHSFLPHNNGSTSGPYWDSTVNVTKGSTTVTLNKGMANVGWNARQFKPTFYFWASNDTIAGATGDYEGYLGPAFVDETTMTLPRPYEGSTGRKEWHLGQFVGSGTQPFVMGKLGEGFAAIYQATNNALALTMAHETAEWIIKYGYHPLTKGLYYFRYMPGCGEPPLDAQLGCSYAIASQTSARALSPEVFRTLGDVYLATGSSEIRRRGDMLYGAVFGKTGYACGVPGTCDGAHAGQPVNDPTNDKWPGFFCGEGGCFSWPAARLGPRSRESRIVMIYFSLQRHELARDAQIEVQDTNGVTVDEQICSESPCAVTISDVDMGRHRYRISLRDGSGGLLLRGGWEPIPMR